MQIPTPIMSCFHVILQLGFRSCSKRTVITDVSVVPANMSDQVPPQISFIWASFTLEILIPLLLSTLSLIINRKKVINENNFSKSRKYLTMTVCWIASFLNPIILDAYYQELKEDVRKLSENHDIRVMTTLRKCRNIKNQIVTFHKTELGQSILLLRFFNLMKTILYLQDSR